ncbi:MAG: glycoside hydrolase/phage tail family protein [Pseudomonadota bacterium]
MATLAFAAVGAAAGSALLPSGLSVLGTTIAGATIGSQIGAIAGGFVDQALFGSSGQSQNFDGPRISDLRVMASSEGASIAKVYGRARLGGQVIWATDFEEVASTEEIGSGGGKGGGGGASSGSTTQTTYSYYANFAVAIAEGELTGLGRVWADGSEIDLSNTAYRFYTGSDTQEADSLIVANLGADDAPAYRGVAYIVFERLPLAQFGNRLPQLSFEVFRSVDDLRERVRGVVVIPGSGEFVYSTEQVTRDAIAGTRVPENVNTRLADTNWAASMDQLATSLPNVSSASLVVSWFGTDLRAGQCEIRPGVERSEKDTRPLEWSVAGATRSTAYTVSLEDGRPVYGGTPSDQTVIAAIKDLQERGIEVALTPFILMDIADGNTLDDPYNPGTSQSVYPWRGRMTVDPAPGLSGSPDKSTAAGIQLSAFIGTAQPSHFSVSGETFAYSGPDEWSYRRVILHHAFLAVAAGGVETFLIGTELRGLTQIRDSESRYPFVDALVELAADVKSILGAQTNVTYAADWSEYFGHQPNDGSGDVYFHLDPLWASSDIDAIGIDLYWPLSDWRSEDTHLDQAEAASIYDLGYLKSNLFGGEGFDWYYVSSEDRDAQLRTEITDGSGKPWVFRYKDIRSWWTNAHFNRPGGVEASQPTDWTPQSKPIWIMETGCPAIDKGANQPNVFYDPKSSESAVPYFSEAHRDDLMQRRYIQAIVEGFDPTHAGYIADSNPVSSVYGGRMVDLDHLHIYAWDARPYPAFPNDEETWGDAPNWRFGHWLNGRFASLPLNEAVARILSDYGFQDFDASELSGSVPGYVIDRIMAAREALQPLELAFFFDAVETGGGIRMRHRGSDDTVAQLEPDGAVEKRTGADLVSVVRQQETELPASAKVRYVSASDDYRNLINEARKLTGRSSRVANADLAIMLESDQAATIAESWLHEAWASRDKASFVLPPSQLALEPGDLIGLTLEDKERLFRVTGVGDSGPREIQAQSIDPVVYRPGTSPARSSNVAALPVVGTADALFLDLPLLKGDEPDDAGYVAIAKSPWPGDIAIYRSPDDAAFTLASTATLSSTVGETLTALPLGPEGRFDFASTLRVVLNSGALQSVSRLNLLAGANAAAIKNQSGAWEVLQFEAAELVAERTYDLSGLLRAQSGTESAMMSSAVPIGAPFVLLNGAIQRIDLTPEQVKLPLNWRYGPASRDIGHSDFAEETHEFLGLGRRPLSPVHVRGLRSNRDLTISWIRRTRTGGDNWEVEDVPLGEEFESYEVDILDGSDVVRTLSALTTSVDYPVANQVADFGSAQDQIVCSVYQISRIWGRGTGRQATV